MASEGSDGQTFGLNWDLLANVGISAEMRKDYYYYY